MFLVLKKWTFVDNLHGLCFLIKISVLLCFDIVLVADIVILISFILFVLADLNCKIESRNRVTNV